MFLEPSPCWLKALKILLAYGATEPTGSRNTQQLSESELCLQAQMASDTNSYLLHQAFLGTGAELSQVVYFHGL